MRPRIGVRSSSTPRETGPPVPLLLRNGGVQNRVTLTAGPGAPRWISRRARNVPSMCRRLRDGRACRWRAKPASGRRMWTPASKDARVLGVWVQVR